VSEVTRLPRTTRLFLAGNTVSMVGTGLVLPFLLIYLHQVRGIALPVVGALLAGAAVAGLIVVPISGALIYRPLPFGGGSCPWVVRVGTDSITGSAAVHRGRDRD
jgi:hypothetical protein